MYFSYFWRLEVQDQGASTVVFGCEPSSLFVSDAFLLCPHRVEAGKGSLWDSFYKALIPFMRAPYS